MADALLELAVNLRNRKDELTSEETKLLNSQQQAARRYFGIGVIGGSIATWLVTRRLNNILRITLTAGAGFAVGMKSLSYCFDSGVEQILSQHGTRIQTELAEILLKKHQKDPRALQRVSKYFFAENVYDDDSTDRAKPRWRFRNFCAEDFASVRVTGDVNLLKTDASQKTILPNKEINTSAAAGVVEASEDPFDWILGHPASVEDTHQTEASSTPPRRRNPSQKKSHHRHRMRHKENTDVAI